STVGGSGYFDGTGDYLTTPDNAAFNLGSSDFLIEAWVYNQSTTNFKMIMGQWNTGQVSYTLRQNASKWVFTYTTNGTTEVAVTGTSNQVLNAWTHLAVIRTGNTLGLFVNGTRETTASMTGVTIHNNTGVFSVGGAGNGGDLYVGYIGSSRLVLGTLPSGYDATQSTLTLPTAPFTSTASTSLLLNFTNFGIYDATAKNVLETVGNAQASTAITPKWGTTSMLFNSDTSWLQQPASVLYGFGTGNFTVECWFYLTASPTTEKGLFHINTAVNNTTAGYAVSTTTTGFNFYAAGTFYASTTTAPVGQWNHLAYVKNSGTVNVYLNGSLIQNGSKADSQNLTNPLCYVGLIYGTTNGSLRYLGYMQDFRVTRFARYTANFTPPTEAFPVQ
ncbi:MAG: LamG-like jellyroll fold domain-containing protein, partial [Polynucleobacter sp.]